MSDRISVVGRTPEAAAAAPEIGRRLNDALAPYWDELDRVGGEVFTAEALYGADSAACLHAEAAFRQTWERVRASVSRALGLE